MLLFICLGWSTWKFPTTDATFNFLQNQSTGIQYIIGTKRQKGIPSAKHIYKD